MSAAVARPPFAVMAMLLASLVSCGCTAVHNSVTKTIAKAPIVGKEVRTIEQRMAMARLFERSNPEEARKMYLAIVSEDPQRREAHHRLGVMAACDGKFEDAERSFQTALSLAKPDAPVLIDYGYALFLQNRLPEAEKVLRDALALEPRNTAATNNLAVAIGQMGRYDEALNLFRQAGSDAEAHANLGYIMAMRGDIEQAKFCYSHALTLNPELKTAAAALMQIAEREHALAGRPIPPLPRRPVGGEVVDPAVDEDRTRVAQLPVTESHDPLSVSAPSIGQMPAGSVPQPGTAIGLSSMAPHTPSGAYQAVPAGYAASTAQPDVQAATYDAPAAPPAGGGAHITGVAPNPR